MADWVLLGGIGKGVTEGLDDKRRMDEAAQLKQLRQYQLDQLKQDAEYAKSLKGLRKVGSATYDNSFQKQGAGVDQAKALDAQTADFGAEGAQATADALAGAKGLSKAAPVKSIPYAASEQARDIADLALKAGKPEIAAQFGDRAFTLGTREVQERVNNWARLLPNMTLPQAAKALADIHTADKTDFAAFMNSNPENPDGLPEITAFDHKTGRSETHTVRNKDELIQLAQMLVDHNARADIKKQQREEAALGIQGRQAGAQEMTAEATKSRADTELKIFNRRDAVGEFQATADKLRAEAKAVAITAPAQAAASLAAANYHNKYATLLESKATNFDEKLPEAQKLLLQSKKDAVLQLTKQLALEPTEQNRLALQSAQFQMSKAFRKAGMEGADEYADANVPPPEQAATAILANNKSQKDIQIAVADASRRFDFDYGNKIQLEVDKKLQEKAKAGTSNSVGPAPSLTPRGIQAPGVLDKVGRAKYLAEQEAEKKTRDEAANAAIAGPMSEWEKRVLANPNQPAITPARP